MGATGRLRFNAELQALVNPARSGEEEYVSSYVDPVTKQKHHLRMRDRVMILKMTSMWRWLILRPGSAVQF